MGQGSSRERTLYRKPRLKEQHQDDKFSVRSFRYLGSHVQNKARYLSVYI